jgi:drug/metabolite transporter (DMT)-like permease
MSDVSQTGSEGQHAFRPSPLVGYLCVAGAALFWAISATMGRAVFTGRLHLFGATVPLVPPLMLAQSRTTIAACILFPVLFLSRGRAALHMPVHEIRDCAIVGILGIAASNYFYYLAIQRTSVATAIILQYLAPAFVLLWMLGRRLQPPTFSRIAGVFVAVAGSVLAIGVVSQSADFPWLAILPGKVRFDFIGVVAALIAAVAFAFYNVFGRHLVEAHDRWTVLAWALAGAAVGWLFVNPPWRVIASHYTGTQWAFMGLFSISSILIPFSLYFAGLHHLDATRAIVTSCLEPVFSIVIAALALGELVGSVQIVGILFVLASTVLVQLETQPGGGTPPIEPME